MKEECHSHPHVRSNKCLFENHEIRFLGERLDAVRHKEETYAVHNRKHAYPYLQYNKRYGQLLIHLVGSFVDASIDSSTGFACHVCTHGFAALVSAYDNRNLARTVRRDRYRRAAENGHALSLELPRRQPRFRVPYP